jgi:uncharacterized protein (DUF58 family)
VEFAEHKEYSPGDETRHIDWKHHAKNDRYYVKQFEQESELTAHLVLDASASMSYQGRELSKLDYGATLFAALAYLLLKQRDRVGLLAFGEAHLEHYVPPRSRPAHLRDLISVISDVMERGGRGEETLTQALERTAELVRRRRSLIVVGTDLFDRQGSAVSVLSHLRARGHDVVLFHVLDGDELTFPFQGLTEFVALEGDHKLLAHPAAIRSHYRTRLKTFLDTAATQCLENGIEYRPTPTHLPLESALSLFLSARHSNVRSSERLSWDL